MAKIPLNKIEQSLVRFDDHDIDEEFIGVAVVLNDVGSPKHSGMVLCYEGEKFFFHFDMENISLVNVTGLTTNIYFKKLDLFPDSYLPYIRAYFDILIETIHPKYGFVFTDSFYDSFGNYITDIEGLPDLCTCVGFCINVIRGLLLKNPKYVEINDWKFESLERVREMYIREVDEYLKKVEKFTPEKLADIKNASYKRITPLELIISGFIAKPKKLPVRKADIDPKVSDTRRILKEKWILSEG